MYVDAPILFHPPYYHPPNSMHRSLSWNSSLCRRGWSSPALRLQLTAITPRTSNRVRASLRSWFPERRDKIDQISMTAVNSAKLVSNCTCYCRASPSGFAANLLAFVTNAFSAPNRFSLLLCTPSSSREDSWVNEQLVASASAARIPWKYVSVHINRRSKVALFPPFVQSYFKTNADTTSLLQCATIYSHVSALAWGQSFGVSASVPAIVAIVCCNYIYNWTNFSTSYLYTSAKVAANAF